MTVKIKRRINNVTVLTIAVLVFTGHWAGPALAQIKSTTILPCEGGPRYISIPGSNQALA